MTESNPPAPPASAPPGPALALKGLASRLEKGPAPDLDEVSEVLAQIRGSKLLDKPSKALVVEVREAVRVGTMPDPLSLRLIAKAVTAAAAAGVDVIAQSSSTLKTLKERAQAVVAAPAAVLLAEIPPAAPAESVFSTPVPLGYPTPPITREEFREVREAIGPAPRQEEDESVELPLDRILASSDIRSDVGRIGTSLREQSDRMIASLTDREREVLAMRFGVEKGETSTLTDEERERLQERFKARDKEIEAATGVTLHDFGIDDEHLAAMAATRPKRRGRPPGVRNGEGHEKVAPRLGRKYEVSDEHLESLITEARADSKRRSPGLVRVPLVVQGSDDVPTVGEFFERRAAEYLDDEEPLTDLDIVSQAADIIEHLDMPAHAGLVGALYSLFERLERYPIPNPEEIPLAERAEQAIERAIARLIERDTGSSLESARLILDWLRWKDERG